MIATNTNKKAARPRLTDRRRDLLREFFANAIVLAAIKSGGPVPALRAKAAR